MGLVVAVGAAAAISVTTVLESVAVVGAVVGAVGAVTHNKTLSMIGLGLGIVGGVGALATSALGIGSAAITGGETAGDATSAAAGAAAGGAADVGGTAEGIMNVGDAAANPAAAVAADAAGGAAPDIVGDLSSAVSSDVPAMDATAAAANPADALPGQLGGGAAGDNVSLLNTTANPDAVAPGTTGTDTSTAASTDVTANRPLPTGPGTSASPDLLNPDGSVVEPPIPPAGGAPAVPGTMSNILSFVEKHPTLAFGALQAGGSLLSGMTSTLTPAQVSALNAQAAANDAAAALTKQQTANLAMPKSVASSSPVTGAPSPLVPSPGQAGLINQAPRVAVGASP